MLYVLLCSLFVGFVGAQTGPLVNVTQGWIRGTVASDGNYYAFYGIPYAGPTSGENRFKAPTPPPDYETILNSTDRNILCAQPGPNGLVGVEDCLTLNIFTTSTTTRNPVLVWLIGEEYTTSNPLQHSFRRLVEENVVVVSMNYRLSIFGFLCLGVTDAPGNAGLKDVVQGLQWIKENINEFGGDPNNIVLFGHGSGGVMVDLVTMSPLAVGLVQKAIVHSGSALAPWAISYDPIGYAQILGAKLGFAEQSATSLAEVFKTIEANVLISGIKEMEFLNNTAYFAPCVENIELNPEDTFLEDAPINLLQSGRYSHIPYITGYTDREGTIRANEAINKEWLEKMHSNFANFLPVDLNLDSNLEQTIREFYFGHNSINFNTVEEYLSYHGDTMILVPVIRGAVSRAATSRAEVRLLEFTYRGTTEVDFPLIPLSGVPHGGVINFLLDINLVNRDRQVMDSLVTRYVQFARTGTPMAGTYEDPTWTVTNPVSNNYLSYYGGSVNGSTAVAYWEYGQQVRRDPQSTKMTFWDDIYSNHYVAPQPVSSADNVTCLLLVLIISQLVIRMF